MRSPFAGHVALRLVLSLLLTECLWGIGAFFTLASTTVPTYLTTLGARPAMIATMAIMMGALPLVLQFFGRSVIERFRHRKRGLILMHMVVIVPYLLIAAADTLLDGSNPRLLMFLVLGLLAFAQLSIGLIIPVWLDMVGQVIPQPVRGRYFGLASGCFALGGIAGALTLSLLTDRLGDGVFRVAFFATGIGYLLSMTMLAFTPVPESAFAHTTGVSVLAQVRRALRACHPRNNFGRLVASYLMQLMAMAIIPFLVVYATQADGLGLPKAIFSRMTVWEAMGGSVGAITLGWLVDRLGARWPWMALTLVIPTVVLLFPHAAFIPVLLLCSVLIGLITTHWSVSAPALLEFSPDGDKSGYIALANVSGLLPTLIGPLLISHAIAGGGYPLAFTFALTFGLLAFALAATIRARPRQAAPLDEGEVSVAG